MSGGRIKFGFRGLANRIYKGDWDVVNMSRLPGALEDDIAEG